MAKTIAAFPLRFNGRGGIAAPPETAHGASLDQVIRIELQPGSTMLPWDRADGIVAPGSTFRVNPAPTIGHVTEFFDQLRRSGRATMSGPITTQGPSADGKTTVQVRYLNNEGQHAGNAEGSV